jgi:Ser/Thr protein kinase RdoA (MazF antagonist)
LNANNTLLAKRILAGYDLAYTNILPPQKGYRNQSFPVLLPDNRTVNLMLHKNEPHALDTIRRADNVSSYLARKGFPCRTMINKVAKLSSKTITKYAALYTYLPGQTIPWEAYTMRHIKLLGKTLSDMHAALAMFKGDLPHVVASHTALNKRLTRYFADKHVRQALKSKLGLVVARTNFRQLFNTCRTLPSQPLHMDFVRGNILFEGERDSLTISGILDFEKTAKGPILLDIARTLAFLLVDCKYKDTERVRKYFLHSGYRKRGAFYFAYTASNKRILDELVTFNLLHDFYKFLRHNPYEFLPQNEHFVRTRDLLVSRGIVKYK